MISLEELKIQRKKFLDDSLNAYKNHSKEFDKLWDKFMHLNKTCIIFTDFPIIYGLYLSHVKDPTNIAKQNIYTDYFNFAFLSLKAIA
jgi:hypothetical protein